MKNRKLAAQAVNYAGEKALTAKMQYLDKALNGHDPERLIGNSALKIV